MSAINYSFTFNGEKGGLSKLKDYLKNDFRVKNEVYEYDEYENDKGELNVFFDSNEYDTLFYVKILKSTCRVFNIDFNCSISSWEFGDSYSAFTFRHRSNSFGQFKLKSNHYKKVKFDEESGTHIFNGKTYEDFDVPLVLCEDMVKSIFGIDIFEFNSEKDSRANTPAPNYDGLTVTEVNKNENGDYIVTFNNNQKLMVMSKDFKSKSCTIDEVNWHLIKDYSGQNVRIPTLNEMILIDKNIFSKGEGNFQKTAYWTATTQKIGSGTIAGTIYYFGRGSDIEDMMLPFKIRLVKDIA